MTKYYNLVLSQICLKFRICHKFSMDLIQQEDDVILIARLFFNIMWESFAL